MTILVSDAAHELLPSGAVPRHEETINLNSHTTLEVLDRNNGDGMDFKPVEYQPGVPAEWTRTKVQDCIISDRPDLLDPRHLSYLLRDWPVVLVTDPLTQLPILRTKAEMLPELRATVPGCTAWAAEVAWFCEDGSASYVHFDVEANSISEALALAESHHLTNPTATLTVAATVVSLVRKDR